MSAVRATPDEISLTYPNRDRAATHITKAFVVLLLLLSAALMLAVAIGGWSQLQGMTPVTFAWVLCYLVIAYFIGRRWARGLLPVAAALALLLLLVSLIAGVGGAGTSWFDRTDRGYAAAQSLFGGAGFSANTLGLLTLLIAPLQALLIVFASQGFAQKWNVEVEVPVPVPRHA